MKNFILVFVMFIMTSVVYAESSVYINQSGSGLDLDITLDGNGSSVGTSSDITQIEGANLDIIVDLKGSNTITGDIYVTGDSARGTGGEELSLTNTGTGNVYTLAIGADGDLSVQTSVIESRVGNSSAAGGTSLYTVGTATGAGDYTDIDVVLTGAGIDINVLENSTASGTNKKVTNINMAVSSADVDIDIDHTGSGNHDTLLDINGSFAASDITVNQSGNTDSTVSMTFDGATSSDIDVIITP